MASTKLEKYHQLSYQFTYIYPRQYENCFQLLWQFFTFLSVVFQIVSNRIPSWEYPCGIAEVWTEGNPILW